MFKKTFTISGWTVRLDGIRISGFRSLYVSSVSITDDQERMVVTAEAATFRIHFGSLLKTRKPFLSVSKITAALVRITAGPAKDRQSGTIELKKNRKAEESQTAEPASEGRRLFPPIALYKLYPTITRLTKAIKRSALKAVDIHKITFQAGLPGYGELTGRCCLNATAAPGSGFVLMATALSISRQQQELLRIEQTHISGIPELSPASIGWKFNLRSSIIHLKHNSFCRDIGHVNQFEGELILELRPNKFEIRKETTFSINDIPVSVRIIQEATDPDLVKSSLLFMIEGETFFQTYPFFNLASLSGIIATGELLVQLDYMLCLSDRTQYYFKTKLLRNDLKIHDFGEFTFPKRETRSRTPATSLPAHLLDVVVRSEDPNFYRHSGIDTYFLGKALAINLIFRRFVRGASTITMQLARNLFLYHERAISRKLDELIIAWLIEGHLGVSKQHILECYLDVIEFGVGVYGIAAAAAYYFNKIPAELTLLEAMVLAYVIPRPKHFLNALLAGSPQLYANLKNHIDFHCRQLAKEGKTGFGELPGIPWVVEFNLAAFANKNIVLQW